MSTSAVPPSRGRPRTITRERIADAGIALGLPALTFVGVAGALGVTHMALYKHVPSLEALKQLVAEEIFGRWALPRADAQPPRPLADYLVHFIASLRDLVRAHPGIAPHLIRRSAATAPMRAKIVDHQNQVAAAYGLPTDRARWLLSTLAFHCIAVADTLYAGLSAEERAADEAEIEAEFGWGMHTLLLGALRVIEENLPLDAPSFRAPAAG